MSGTLSPFAGAGWQFFNNSGAPLSGGFLYTYAAGSTTPLATYTDSTLATPNANPIVLSAAGRVTPEIWLQNNTGYKFVLTDPNNNVIGGPFDNIVGINSSTTIVSEWTANNLVPTYISATQFSVPGNLLGYFTVNRRVQYVVSGGTFYGYISGASYAAGTTTVTIVPDSTGMDSSLSSVYYGILNPTNPSVPQNYANTTGPVTFASNITVVGSVISNNLPGRNKIINGAMRVAQRSTTYALTTTVAYGSLDAWGAAQNTSANGHFNLSTTAPAGFQNSAQLGRNTGSVTTGSIFMATALTTADTIPLSNQNVTLSFWAKAGAGYSGGNLGVLLDTGTGTDQSLASMCAGSWTGFASAVNTTQAITTTWTRYSFTASIGAVTQMGVRISFTPAGTAVADDNVYVTGVQLEVGTLATPFEVLSFAQDLNACLTRAWVPFYTAAGGDIILGSGTNVQNNIAEIFVPLPVTMRAPPSAFFAAYNGLNLLAGNVAPSSAPAVVYANANSCSLQVSVSGSPLTIGGGQVLVATLSSNFFVFSSDL